MAATDPVLYTLIYVLADGALLSEEASVTMSRTTGSTEAKTIHGGYSGEMPGSPMIELDVSSMVPASGIEFDAGDHMEAMTPVEIGLLAFGQQLTFKGFLVGDSLKHSVNGAAGYDFRARGRLERFE